MRPSPLVSLLCVCIGATVTKALLPDAAVDRTYNPAEVELVVEQCGFPVISAAQKFVVPVPKVGDHSGADDISHIRDWQGRPVGERGLLFYNFKDRSEQACNGDGNGVVIINQVDAGQAKLLDAQVRRLTQGAGPDALTLDGVRSVLQLAIELGLTDMYNSDRAFVMQKMTPVVADDPAAGAYYGFLKRDDRDVCVAVAVQGRLAYEGIAATPQLFSRGAVFVRQRVGNRDEIRGVQPDAFLDTYRNADGSPVTAVPWCRRHRVSHL